MSDVSAGRLYLEAVADTSGFAKDAKAKIAAEVKGIRAQIKAELDSKGIVGQAKRAAAEARKAAVVKLKVELDGRGIVGQAKAIARTASAAAVVRFRTEVDATNLKRQALAAGSASHTTLHFGADFDEAKFEASLAAAVARLSAQYTINVNVDAQTAGASAHMAAWRASQQANGISIPFSLDFGGGGGLGGILGSLRALMVPALAGAVALLTSALSALAGGLTAIVGAASQAAAGLAVLPGLMGTIVGGVGALFGALAGVGDAVKELGEQDTQGAREATQNADARVQAAQAIEDAQERLAEAYHQARDAARAARYAVEDALWAEQEATEENADAQDRLNEARKDAKKYLDDLRESLERMALTEDQAANNLTKARAALQDLMWDASATPQEIADAQLNVEEAQQNLDDVKDQHAELTEQVEEANEGGVAGTEIMQDAQEAASDAAHALMLAQRGVTEALHSQGDVARQNQQSIEAAQEALAAANKAATDSIVQQNIALADANEAYNKLSPAGQRFADFIYNVLRPRVNDLRHALQGAVLPPLQRGITAAMPFFDTLQEGLVGTGGVVGRFTERLGRLFGSEGFNKNSATIMDSNNRALGNFGRAVQNLIKWLQDITVVAGPTLLEPFARWTRNLTRTWKEMAQTGRETGTMEKRFNKARETVRLLADIIGNVASALHGIFGAAAPAGDSILSNFERLTQRWANWQNSLEGQNAVKDWVDKSRAALNTFGRVMGSLGPIFSALFNPELFGTAMSILESMTPTIKTIAGVVQSALSPVLSGLGEAFEVLGPKLQDLFVALEPLLSGVGAVIGEIIVQAADMIGTLLSILTPVIGWISRIVGPLLTKFAEPIAFIILAFTSWGGSIVKVIPKIGKLLSTIIGFASKVLRYFKPFTRVVIGIFSGALDWFSPIVDAVKWVWDVLFGHSIFPDLLDAFMAFVDALAPIFSGVAAAFGLVIDAATWLWRNVIAVAFPAIRTIISLWWAAVKVYFNAVVAIVQAIGDVAMWLWRNVIAKAFPAIRAIISAWWTGVKTYFSLARKAIRLVADVVSWLWRKIVAPAFRVMKRLIGVWWSAVKVYFGLARKAIRLVADIVLWLWRKAVQPAFRAIGRIVSLWWSGVKVIFKAVVRIVEEIGDVVEWLWKRAVKPAFEGIRNVISTVWKRGIKPVFDTLVDFVKNDIPDAFDAAKRGIETIWNGLKEIAAAPIRFVVETVYNNGIRKVVNAIPGVDDLAPVSIDFARGGTFGAGTLPGYSPGHDNYSFASTDGKGIRLGLGGGESIMRPEWTKAVGPRAVALMNAAARRGQGALAAAFQRLGGRRGDAGAGPGYGYADGGIFSREKMDGALAFAKSYDGAQYEMGGYGPTYFDCSGFMAAISNYLRDAVPVLSRLGSTATFPWPGFQPGVGQFTIGSTPNYGGSGVGHMAGTLLTPDGPVNVESRAPTHSPSGGVQIGGAARGYSDSGFTETGHLGLNVGDIAAVLAGQDEESGWRKAISAILSAIKNFPGMVTDLGDKFGDWGAYAVDMVKSVGNDLRGWINDKIPDSIEIPGPNIPLLHNPIPKLFDRGGQWVSGSMGMNLSGSTETVFTNENIVDLTSNLAQIARGLRGQTTNTNTSSSGNSGLTIEGGVHLTAPPEKAPEVLDELRHTLRVLALGGVHARGTLGGPV